MNNVGSKVISKNSTSFSSVHLVVALKLFLLCISRQYGCVAWENWWIYTMYRHSLYSVYLIYYTPCLFKSKLSKFKKIQMFLDNWYNFLRPTATLNMRIKYLLLSMLTFEWIRMHPQLTAVKICQTIQKATDHINEWERERESEREKKAGR